MHASGADWTMIWNFDATPERFVGPGSQFSVELSTLMKLSCTDCTYISLCQD